MNLKDPISPESLSRIFKNKRLLRPFTTFIVANGCFDLLHAGHISMLKEAKESVRYPSYLVVGINSDKAIRELKGESRPLVPQDERLYCIENLGVVDFAFIFDSMDFSPYLESFGRCVFVKGSDYEKLSLQEYKALQKNGSTWKFLKTNYKTRTSSLIKKIK